MTKDEIFQVIVRNCREILPELKAHRFQPQERLKDIGANSIDRAEIIAMTMESLSLNIPRVELFGAKNIGELVDVFYDKSN